MALQIPILGVIELLFRQQPGYNPAITPYDVRLYFDAASRALTGQWPYRDFFFPYPPLAIALFLPTRLIAGDPRAYFHWFKIELLIMDWLGLVATAWIARRVGQAVVPTLTAYTLALPFLGPIVLQRFDLAPAVIVIFSLGAWLHGRYYMGWVLLAAGTLTKVYPALLLPLYSIAAWRTSGWRALGYGWLIFGLVTFAGLFPFLLVAPQATIATLGAQSGRGLEIESTLALLLLAARFSGLPTQVVYNQDLNTWEVTAPNADYWQVVAFALSVILLSWAYWRFFSTAPHESQLVSYSVAIIIIGLLTSKVFSPQFMLWLFPSAFLCGKRRFALAALLFLLSALLTQTVYPFLWSALKQQEALPVGLLLLRDVVLACLCALLLRYDE